VSVGNLARGLRVVFDDGAKILGDSDGQFRRNPFYQDGLRCDTWTHAVGNPIRASDSAYGVGINYRF
jgi:hypothetical protein